MAKDYSSSSAEEQLKNGELSASQILKYIGKDPKTWKVEKSFSGDAVNSAKKKVKNVQIYQWELYEKVKGKWVKRHWNKDWFNSKNGLNNCAVYGENGIVIIKPFTLAKSGNLGTVSTVASSSDSVDLADSSFSTDLVGGGFGAVNYDVVGYSGEDEKIIKHLSFIKIQLLKECYEFTGVLLQSNKQ